MLVPVMLDAAFQAKDAGLGGFATRLAERATSLRDQVLPDLKAAIKQLQDEAKRK